MGQTTIAASSLADFAAVLLLSLLFSADGMGTGSQLLLFALFAGIVTIVGLAAATTAKNMRLGRVLVRLQDSTADIRVRAAMLLLIAFAVSVLVFPAAALTLTKAARHSPGRVPAARM